MNDKNFSLLKQKNKYEADSFSPGFTLIETLIYASLVAAILTFSLAVMYQVIQTSDKAEARRAITENQKMLIQKLSWALAGVDAVNSPTPGSRSSTLSVNKTNYAYNPLVFRFVDGRIDLSSGATTTALTTEDVKVASFVVTHRVLSGITVVEVNFELENDAASTTVETSFTIE